MEPKIRDTAYCGNCMCYVPEDVACADEECPVEGHINTADDGEPEPINFRLSESSLDDIEFNPFDVQDDVYTITVERVPREDDDCSGC